METVYYYVAVIVVLFVFLPIALYNRLIRRKNEVNNAFASIDVMLKKRFDLLPNLIEVTKKYMNHEMTLLTEITALRSQVNSDIKTNDKVDKYNKLQQHARSLLLNVENYPDLKSNNNFMDLQKTWNTAEEQISASRRYYNTAVTAFNNAIESFPSNLIAKYFHFEKMKVFEIDKFERKNISAKDLFNK